MFTLHPNFSRLVPDPLSTVPKVDAYSNRATVTWQPLSDCQKFNTYVVLNGDVESPVNNGQGLLLTEPTVTLLAVRNPFFLPPHFGFSLNSSEIAGPRSVLHRESVLWQRRRL